MNISAASVASRLVALSALAAAFAVAPAQTTDPTAPIQTPAAQPAAPEAVQNAVDNSFLKGLLITGWFDAFYQYSFQRPGSNIYGPVFGNLNGRQLDVKSRAFTLNEARLNISRPAAAKNEFGFTASLAAGGATDIIHANEPAGADAYKLFQQLYATYNVGSGVTLDFGKFLTWIGYEGINTPFNDNYSLNFTFFIAQPTYHTGFRLAAPLAPGLTGSLFAVQGWNEVEDSNDDKSFGAQLGYAKGKTSLTLGYYGGTEGREFGADNTNFGGIFSNGTTRVSLGDFIAVYNASDKLKLALNVDYGDFRASDRAASLTALDGKVTAVSTYAKYAFTPKTSGTLRFEVVRDRRLNSAFAFTNLSSLTGTFDYSPAQALLLRFELRQDWANKDVFENQDGPGTKRDRTTATFAIAYKF